MPYFFVFINISMQSSLFCSHRFHRSHVKNISKNIFSFLTMIYDLCIKIFYVSLTIKICTNNFFHWPVVRIHPWLVLILLVLCQNCETLFLFQYFSVQRKCEWQELLDWGWTVKISFSFTAGISPADEQTNSNSGSWSVDSLTANASSAIN